MRTPNVQGTIDRRILVNYRVDADVLGRMLPAPFRPKLIAGQGLAGICLIRLQGIRPQAIAHRRMPTWLGVSSENAAHRAAVTWEENGSTREGVFIFRRDTSSRFNAIVGGRLFPGVHHLANFDTQETQADFHIEIKSHDRSTKIGVAGHLGTTLAKGSVFETLENAARFIELGSIGYSPSIQTDQFDGLELKLDDSSVRPLILDRIESSFFDDRHQFPPGSIEFDSALLMRDVRHTWHDLGLMRPETVVRCGC